jgi:ferredoxin-thioredoxin reductase catalytic chain
MLSNKYVVLIIGAIDRRVGLNFDHDTEADSMTTSTQSQATDKSLEAMRHFSETYAQRTGTYFCVDPGVTAVVIEGLAKHKDELGAPLCPCRHYEDKEAEAAAAYWNCPCVPMRERKECHCMLFLTPENDFAGDRQDISFEEIRTTTSQY